ncbi:MAG TPA: response regulator transcription factor [Solirubrobacteraceae bacterium]|nr:response regulator transcription factor [Solirubrobacteraceae bacterium]
MTLRCVIVDDNPAVLRAASDLLEREGLAVVGVATTSEEALFLMRDLRPDVLLVDIDLGPESGLDLARRLEQSPDTAPARTILISTHDEADFADLIAASPAIGFLSKADLSATAIRELLTPERGERS